MIPSPGATLDPTLLSFNLKGTPITLPTGKLVSSFVDTAYRDVPASDLEGLNSEIVAGRPWREAVADRYRTSYPWLHTIMTDPARLLFFRQFPPTPGCRILDVGAGLGQFAVPLARNHHVCALEPTPERIHFIELVARQEGVSDRLWFLQAEMGDVDFAGCFDLVTCIGVLEWVGKFTAPTHPVESQRQFLKQLRSTLKPGGQVVIGIENRIGLKYLLGAVDDHIGRPGVTVYDYDLADSLLRRDAGVALRAVTHTRAELEALLIECGFCQICFFGAFPDYKIPQAIVPLGADTESWLEDNFIPEHDGTNGRPLAFQDQLRSHYRTLADLRVASNFVPSFFVTCVRGPS